MQDGSASLIKPLSISVRFLCIFFVVLGSIASNSLFFATTQVAALSDTELNKFAQNDILFYDPSEEEDCVPSRPTGKDITWIGDSYSVGAEYKDKLITKKLPGVDLGSYDNTTDPPAGSYIKDGKLFANTTNSTSSDNPTGIALLKKITKNKTLRPYLVFALGTNGDVTKEYIDELINLAGANTKIILTTIYTAKSDHAKTNEIIKKAAKDNSNIFIADWASVAKSEYYEGDKTGIHPVDHYDKWVDIIYEALPESGGSSSADTSDNKLYNGNPVISDDLMKKVKENQSFYESAAKKYDIPWQILAVLHIREHSAERSNPDNGQGIYQFYDASERAKCTGGNFTPGKVSDDQFQVQTDCAAKRVKEHYGADLDLSTDDGIKEMFFAYNGKASAYIAQARDLGFTEEEAKHGEGSPYVMNMADEKRDPTKNHNWKQIVTDGGSPVNYPANTVPGAYLMYRALGGVGSICASPGNGDLNKTALLLSWPDDTHSPDDPKPEYYKALHEKNGVATLGEGDSCSIAGKSCDAFVATVMRYSGADEDFPCCGVSTLYDYLSSHPDLYEEIPNIGSAENMKPGDIRIKPGQHVEMYVVLEDGKGMIASASHCDRTGDHASPYYADSAYKIYRKK